MVIIKSHVIHVSSHGLIAVFFFFLTLPQRLYGTHSKNNNLLHFLQTATVSFP